MKRRRQHNPNRAFRDAMGVWRIVNPESLRQATEETSAGTRAACLAVLRNLTEWAESQDVSDATRAVMHDKLEYVRDQIARLNTRVG